MKDNTLIITHDYNMFRLTDFGSDDQQYLFERNWSDVQNLRLRQKDEAVSNYNYLRFEDMIDLIKANKLVLMIDIKEAYARIITNSQGKEECIARCEYGPDDKGRENRKKDWLRTMKLCYDIAKQKNALEYIAFKIPYFYTDAMTVLSEDELGTVLFMPVIQPGTTVNNTIDMIEDWGPSKPLRLASVAAYETNFKQLSEPVMQRFKAHDDQYYDNILHYVYKRTRLRGGMFSQEPVGARGLANRFGEWVLPDATTDIRGDHYTLSKVPYGHIMLITTDRPDIWRSVSDFMNGNSVK